ncbi:MAG: SusC/RagA family TonB-linked outer membrane protein [Alloprevotella sp.]
MRKKLVLFSASLLLAAGSLMAQKRVTGTVVDQEGHPLPGATVRVDGTKMAVVTDNNGKFVLPSVPTSARKLNVSYLGMQTQEVAVGTGNVQVVLKDKELDEAIVVAYGTAKKGEFTGSVTTIKSENIEKLAVSDMSKALEGAMPGVQLSGSSGQPGAASSIVIRGVGSMFAGSDPLIVVDGVPFNGSLSFINNADVASISVQKDAAATSMYGSRAANGVILITTKKGSRGKTNVSFEGRWGWSNRGVPLYNTVDNEGDYYEVFWEALKNNRLTAGLSDFDARIYASKNLVNQLGGYNSYNVAATQLIDPITGKLNSAATLLYHDDWSKDPFETGLRQEYNVNIDGGNEQTQFFTSFGYLKENSYVKESGFERVSGRLNLNHQAYRWLRLGVNANFTHTGYNANEGIGDLLYIGQSLAPIYPIWERDVNGEPVLDDEGDRKLDFGYGNGHNRPVFQSSNPLSQIYYDVNRSTTDVFGVRSFAEVYFTKGLKLTANFAYDQFNQRATSYQTPITGGALSVNGRGEKSTRGTRNLLLNQLLTYTKSFNEKHNIDLLLGHESQENETSYLYALKEQFFLPDNTELAGAVDVKDATSYLNRSSMESYFFRANYNYLQKYFLMGSVRTDGSSRFSKDNRWGWFWSVSGSWLMNKEQFLADARWINELKLKASYGTQGNDNVGTLPFDDLYQVVQGENGAAVTQVQRGNKDLKWEKGSNFNIGVDARLLHRFGLGVEFFVRETSDMITRHYVSPSEGSPSSYLTNEMAMRNKGVEVTFDAILLNKPDFKWTASLNLTHYKNELVTLQSGKDPNGYAYSANYWHKKGGDIYNWYMVKFAGVDPTNGDALYYMDQADAEGNVSIVTTNDPSKATRYEIGKKSTPDLYGGLSTQFEAFGFDLSIVTAFSIGGWVYDGNYQRLMSLNSAGSGVSSDIYKRWQQPGDVTDIPRIELQNPLNSDGIYVDRFLTKGSYFSLKNITLGYTYSTPWLRGHNVQSLRAYVSGDNLWLASKRKGLDPRRSLSGDLDGTYYSPMRIINLGVKIQF